MKKKNKNKIRKYGVILLNNLTIPIVIIITIFVLVSFITEILYIAIKNEDISDIENEIKYYTDAEYTSDESQSFLDSVSDFISGIFDNKIGKVKFPVEGKTTKDITSYYGKRIAPVSGASTFHNGVDISATQGTKLIAVSDGEIIKTAWGGADGYTIIMKSEEYIFLYCHCDPEFIVSEGDKVNKGQVIGNVGPKNVYGVNGNIYKDESGNPTNGATTGCHCHFTVKKNGQTIDPLIIFKGDEEI